MLGLGRAPTRCCRSGVTSLTGSTLLVNYARRRALNLVVSSEGAEEQGVRLSDEQPETRRWIDVGVALDLANLNHLWRGRAVCILGGGRHIKTKKAA